MNTDELTGIIQHFSQAKILVIGDLILDRYLFGDVDRISPEAPIPVVLERSTTIVPGGAANTAANIAALGANCTLIGVVGDDSSGSELQTALGERKIAIDGIITVSRPTTEKMRVIGNHQQIVRIDREQVDYLTSADESLLITAISQHLSAVDAVVICDYAKGVISESLLDTVRALAHKHNIPVLADVRPEHTNWYHDLSLITPNKKELAQMTGRAVRTKDDALAVGLDLAHSLHTTLLVTLSEEGLLVIDKDSGAGVHFPTRALEVTDVSGAGDTVMAACALALANGANLEAAAEIANFAASVVVAKLGTAVVSQAELLAAMSRR